MTDKTGQLRFPELVDIETLAPLLGVGERHIRRLVDERRIPFVRIGYFVRFDPVDVARWVRAHRFDPGDRSVEPGNRSGRARPEGGRQRTKGENNRDPGGPAMGGGNR